MRRSHVIAGGAAVAVAAVAAGVFFYMRREPANEGGSATGVAAPKAPAPGAPPPGTHTVFSRRNGEYPFDSRPLGPGDGRILHPDVRPEKRAPLRTAAQPNKPAATGASQYLLTADRYWVTGDQTWTSHLSVYPDGTSQAAMPVEIQSAEVILPPEKGTAPRSLMKLSFRDDGKDGDDAAGDHVYSVRVNPRHLPLGIVFERVLFKAGDDEAQATIPFYYTPPDDVPATFDGTVTDAVRDGSLVCTVGLQVKSAGIYLVDGNLFDAGGAPVARASKRTQLEVGHQTVDLRFYGKVLRDQGKPGPYVLRDVRGYRYFAGKRPDRAVIPDLTTEHRTADFPLTQLTDQPYHLPSAPAPAPAAAPAVPPSPAPTVQ